MERYCPKKQLKHEIDLTLKLSPWGENAEEERKLTRSSSLVSGEKGKMIGSHQWGPIVPCLDRSSSLPVSGEKRMLLEKVAQDEDVKCPVVSLSPQYLAFVAASAVNTQPRNNLNAHANSSQSSQLEGPRCSPEGVGYNFKTSIKKENDSIISRKTVDKETGDKLENPPKRIKLGNYCSLKGDVMEILRQMPSVTTTGDGPNGKRIEGFLYKYRSGQVCIVCVCHGSFLTPAEFVMHAGGNEVANPMKRITVFHNSF